MRYAKVAFGLPLDGPFDYSLPPELEGKVRPGMRVEVSFGVRKQLGYVIALSAKSSIKKVKPLLALLDNLPVLSPAMLSFTGRLADYYCCSWGEAIASALPEPLRKRKGREFSFSSDNSTACLTAKKNAGITLLHASGREGRWQFYLEKIKEAAACGSSSIIILPDSESADFAREVITNNTGQAPVVLRRKAGDDLQEWLRAREGRNIVLGTRSAVFAPVPKTGLIIVDQEQDYAHKQEQAPHYHAREAAIIRAGCEGARVILGSSAPSLEAVYLVKKGKADYVFLPAKSRTPEIKILDTRGSPYLARQRDSLLSRYLQDLIAAVLNTKGKVLVFLNRKGFATSAVCNRCGAVLQCGRCNSNLVYYRDENILRCMRCNFRMPAPSLCPKCNSGYLRYAGIGLEKLESELARLFPQAAIKIYSGKNIPPLSEADILISTQQITRHQAPLFDLAVALGVDNSLSHADFRSAERVFGLLRELMSLTEKRLVIPTDSPGLSVFRELSGADPFAFYDGELKERKQLKLPPYYHLAAVKIRGPQDDKVRQIAEDLFKVFSAAEEKNVAAISLVQPSPAKLRGKFYWQITLRSAAAPAFKGFLKERLKKARHSGIIVSVDVDPL